MSTPQVHLAYAPRGVGLAFAVVYLEKDPDICGWWIGAIGADMASAYFRLEGFYTRAGTTLYAAEWLVFETDRDAHREAQAYRDAELSQGRVNIRFAKLNKLERKIRFGGTFRATSSLRWPIVSPGAGRWTTEETDRRV